MANFSDKVASTDSLRVATGKSSATVDALKITPTANSSPASILTITNAPHGQATTLTIPDVGAATGFIMVSQSPSVAVAPAAFIRIVTVNSTQLANSGSVLVQQATSPTCQFQILDLKVLGIGGLTGVNGDRLLGLLDNQNKFNSPGISAVALRGQQMVFWGTSDNPGPQANLSTTTAPGSDITLRAIFGTSDYTGGSQTIMVTLAQVTP